MSWNMQISWISAVILYCLVILIESREISTNTNRQSPLRGSQSLSPSSVGLTETEADDDDALREGGGKRELGEIAFHHGGPSHGHHHGHATSYQNFVLHSYHPKKVIYHKKHGHHHSPPPGIPVVPHHVPVPVAAAAVPAAYDDGTADEGSYPVY